MLYFERIEWRGKRTPVGVVEHIFDCKMVNMDFNMDVATEKCLLLPAQTMDDMSTRQRTEIS